METSMAYRTKYNSRRTGEAAAQAAGLAIVLWLASAPLASADPIYPFATAMRGCTQEDAPALEVYLTETPFDGVGQPPLPYVRIEIAAAATTALAPSTLALSPLRRDINQSGRLARAQLSTVIGRSQFLDGTVAITSGAQGEELAGNLDGVAPGGEHLMHNFDATWVSREDACG